MGSDPLRTTFGADDATMARVASELGVTPGRTVRRRRQWFDTFDWRLWQDGLVLEVDRRSARNGAHLRAVLRNRDDNAVQWTQTITEVPERTADLPPGPWQRSFGARLDERALLAAAGAMVTTTSLLVTDKSDKTVVELLHERLVAGDHRSSSRGGVGVLRVVPQRGYERSARRVVERLERLGLEPMPAHPLELMSHERVVGHDPSALDVVLDPTTEASDAVRQLLSTLLLTMQANEPWLAHPPDVEFLHDWRVALRRSRSVLKQAGGAVGPAVLDEWRPRLRDLQQRTNHARDLDVFLEEFADQVAAVPPAFAADLEPLRQLVVKLRAAEQRKLVAYFRSRRHSRFHFDYAALLAHPLPDHDAPNAVEPVAGFAADRVKRANRRLLTRGAAITRLSPASDLHELRISGKELRYLLELYASVFAPVPLAEVTKELKRLQNTLGAHQDAEIQADALADYAQQLEQAARPPARTLVAIGHLAAAASARQTAARKEFASRFRSFSSHENQARIKTLLRSARSR